MEQEESNDLNVEPTVQQSTPILTRDDDTSGDKAQKKARKSLISFKKLTKPNWIRSVTS